MTKLLPLRLISLTFTCRELGQGVGALCDCCDSVSCPKVCVLAAATTAAQGTASVAATPVGEEGKAQATRRTVYLFPGTKTLTVSITMTLPLKLRYSLYFSYAHTGSSKACDNTEEAKPSSGHDLPTAILTNTFPNLLQPCSD